MNHRRSRLRRAHNQWWHRHGQTVGICMIVLVSVVAVGLLIWFMSDIRFQAR